MLLVLLNTCLAFLRRDVGLACLNAILAMLKKDAGLSRQNAGLSRQNAGLACFGLNAIVGRNTTLWDAGLRRDGSLSLDAGMRRNTLLELIRGR